MATIEKRGRKYRIVFCVGGKTYSRFLKTDSERVANASLARLEDTLRRVELGTFVVLPQSDLASLLLSDGQQAQTTIVCWAVLISSILSVEECPRCTKNQIVINQFFWH